MFHVIQDYKDRFLSNYEVMLSSNTFVLLIKDIKTNGLLGLPNLILYGNDEMILDLCLKTLLNAVCHSTSEMIKKEPDVVHKFPHHWNPHFLHVDTAVFLSEDRKHFIDHIRHMVAHECIDNVTKRHIMVVKNAHTMTQNMFLSLRKMIEDDKHTCFFVFLTTNFSKIESAIVSRCMNVRCTISPETENNPLSSFTSSNPMLETFIKDRLSQMTLLKPGKEIVALIEDTAFRIETCGIRPEKVCNVILNVFVKYNIANKPERIPDIVQLLASSQVKIMQSNKLAFVLEELLYEFFDLII